MKKHLIEQTDHWKYILVQDKYSLGICEGFFNNKNELLYYTEGFETLSVPEDEGIFCVKNTLKMMLKDIQKDKRILDKRLGVKKCLVHFNKQNFQGS
jgi:hypothetical protein